MFQVFFNRVTLLIRSVILERFEILKVLMAGNPTRWGILSVGRISNDFVTALKILPRSEHLVVAVAARDEQSAKTFASEHNIEKSYGSYEALIKDAEVEVVYIGTINTQHLPLAKLAISHGKHVLCEKPLCINLKETESLVQFAKQENVFLMEGIWSRTFPAYHRLKEKLAEGEIGEVLQVSASLGCPLSEVPNCSQKSLGGGSLLNFGIYCVQLATLVFGKEKPTKILAGGHLNKDGVDESLSITLVYENGRIATLMSHIKIELPNDAVIVGTKGMIKIPAIFVCPTEITFCDKTEKFDLPKCVPDSKFNYPNSEGLSFEAQEVRRCLQQNLKESPNIPLRETLLIAEIMEIARKQIGVSYNQD